MPPEATPAVRMTSDSIAESLDDSETRELRAAVGRDVLGFIDFVAEGGRESREVVHASYAVYPSKQAVVVDLAMLGLFDREVRIELS
jgi:hypothetical protein